MTKVKKADLVGIDGKAIKKKKPSLMLGRPIARVPMWENQIKLMRAVNDLHRLGYKLYYRDMESIEWWLKHHSSCRNAICREFLSRDDCEYLVWLDDDMTWENLANDIETMIAHDKDIVMGITSCKPVPHYPNLIKFTKLGDDGTILNCESRHIYEFPEDKLFEIDAGSFGFVVMKRKVIEKIPPPWFYFPPNYWTGNVWGEDVTFCYLAKMYGFEIWVDPEIVLGHIGYTAWHYKKEPTHWSQFKEQCVQKAKDEGWDCSHNLVPEVQEVFKKGEGPKGFMRNAKI